MRKPILRGTLAALAAIGMFAGAHAADSANDGGAWFDAFAGRPLKSIDGSSIELSPGEGTLVRKIVAPDGSVQRTAFTFLNDTLGTVSDDSDAGKAVAVFRETGNGLEAQFSDGHSETLLANAGDGLSMVVRAPDGKTFCMAWYPKNHAFSDAERQAAVAEYASRLGVVMPVKADAPANDACAAPLAKTDKASPKGAAKTSANAPAKPVPPRLSRLAQLTAIGHGGKLAAAAVGAPLVATGAGVPVVATGAGVPVVVRTSAVHPVDAPVEPRNANALQPVGFDDANYVAETGEDSDGGASACLAVRSDGSHWGFKNRCNYAVQFVYCLRGGGNSLTSCDYGAIPGSLSARGFTTLLADRTLSERDVDHRFRWIACAGGAGEVVPRFDRTDPPEGRCIRAEES